MRDRLSTRIEVVANLFIIIAAALGALVLLKEHILTNRARTEGREISARADSSSPRESLVGQTLSLPGMDWEKNGQTLLVCLSKGCHFCTESAPSYQRIAQEAAHRKNFQVVAVFPEDVNEARGYLDQMAVQITEVRQFALSSVGVRGTPTLLLVNKSGAIKDAWLGRLRPDKEAEVFQRIG